MRWVLVWLWTGFAGLLSAQDLHHSQFWKNPMAANPATAGLIEGDFVMGTYSRTQWLSVTRPYQTNGLWFGLPFMRRVVQQDIFGTGVSLDADRAGDAKYRTLQADAYFSYSKAINRKNNHFLSAGLMLGWVQRQLRPDLLSFDDQYHDGSYDPLAVSRDALASSSFSYLDVGVGVHWLFHPSFASFKAGFGLFHFNRPSQSLLKDKDVLLPMKYTGTFQMEIPMGSGISVWPSLYASRQEMYTEVMMGALISYALHFDQKGYVNHLQWGIDYRVGDAVYAVVGGDWRQFQLQLSYDFNVSSLSKASNGRGGLEMHLVYLYKKPKVFRRHKVPCPIF